MPSLDDAMATARTAVIDAISQTAHLTKLRADSPGIGEMIDAIVKELAHPGMAWAMEEIIAHRCGAKP
jgi:hypothetical protein